MATLYLDRKGLDVRLDGTALALYENGNRIRTVPLALLQRVVIRSETSLSTGVLGALGEKGCSTVVLSGRRGRRMAFVHGLPHNDASVRIAQYARSLEPEWRLTWARRFVANKIARQRKLIDRAAEERRDLRPRAATARRTLGPLYDRVVGQCSSIEELRGLEGAAQAAYFRCYTKWFAPSLQFEKRTRRPPRDPVNACLSLGYTLVHFEAVRVAFAAGLDPLLGFFHEIAFGRESLACDLIEPLRPLVDRWVWELFRSRTLRPEHFKLERGACVLGKAGRARFYEQFERLLGPANARLRGYCRLLAKDLRSRAPVFPAGAEMEEW